MDRDDPRDWRDDTERLFAAHYDRVYQTVLRLVHDPTDAQDLTQETFVKAYRGLPQFRGDAALNTWLTRIAQNVVLDHYRHAARTPTTVAGGFEGPEIESLPAEAALTPPQAAEQKRSGACVQMCVDSLSDKYRQAVQLHDMLGMSNPDIARTLGVSIAAVKIWIHRGREQLRSRFEQHCEVYRDERNELSCRPTRSTQPGSASRGRLRPASPGPQKRGGK